MRPSVHTSGHSRWIRRSHRPDVLSSPNYRAHSSPFKRGIISRKVNQRKGSEASETCVVRRRQEKGASVFGIYIISYNAGYAKYRGVKKPSFPDFGPFQRLLSLLGWLERFFAYRNVAFYMFLAVFIIVRSLAESFPALMSSTSPLDSDAAYSQRAFLFPNGLNSSYNTITLSVHWA